MRVNIGKYLNKPEFREENLPMFTDNFAKHKGKHGRKYKH